MTILLDVNGLQHVAIEAVGGRLSDHYDPRSKILRLSPEVYGTPSIAAVGVAAHEAGHALQDRDNYAPLKLRGAMVPAVQIGGNRKVFSGGATATMVRYPSHSGQARQSFAPFEATNWMEKVRSYQPAALREWTQAVDRIVAKWPVM